ncbi:hypothetical protein ACIGXF_33370 [Streptomyces sp. NPDC053086]|uniref:hypothetical protein n=1 Tax=unclassified Streptomyces TaxID=2593676 RepID=UPI0037CF08FD
MTASQPSPPDPRAFTPPEPGPFTPPEPGPSTPPEPGPPTPPEPGPPTPPEPGPATPPPSTPRTADTHLAGIGSHSAFLITPDQRRTAFLQEERARLLPVFPDGLVQERYDVLLSVARKP